MLLGTPTVKPLQTFAVPSGDGVVTTEFGVKVIIANINWFDAKAQSLITTLGIPSGALPIFLTTQTFLTSGARSVLHRRLPQRQWRRTPVLDVHLHPEERRLLAGRLGAVP